MNVVDQPNDRFTLPEGREKGDSILDINDHVDRFAATEKRNRSEHVLGVVAASSHALVVVLAGWSAVKQFDGMAAIGQSRCKLVNDHFGTAGLRMRGVAPREKDNPHDSETSLVVG